MADTMNTRKIHPLGVNDEKERIRAAIRTILLTSIGEVPFRPGFGLGAEQFLGGSASSLDLAYDVALQLTTYEPRIKVKRVVANAISPGRAEIEIYYQVLTDNTTQTIKI